MAKLLTRKDIVSVAKETTFNVAPVFSKTIMCIEESLGNKIEYKDDPVITDTMSARKGVLGKESVDGRIVVRMKGSGAEDIAPEFSDILECAIGSKTIDNILHKIKYGLANADLPSLAAAIWRGNAEKFVYTGMKVSKWEIPLKQGEIITFGADFKGAVLQDIISQVCPLTPAYDATPPIVAKHIVFKINDVSSPVINATISGENTVEEDDDMTTDGIGDITFNGRKILMDLEMRYPGSQLVTDFKSGAEASIEIICGTVAFNMFKITMPKLVYQEIPFAKEKGRYGNKIKAQAFADAGEDEFELVFY